MTTKKNSGYLSKFLKRADKAIEDGIKRADEILDDAVEFGTITIDEAKKTRDELVKKVAKKTTLIIQHMQY